MTQKRRHNDVFLPSAKIGMSYLRMSTGRNVFLLSMHRQIIVHCMVGSLDVHSPWAYLHMSLKGDFMAAIRCLRRCRHAHLFDRVVPRRSGWVAIRSLEY